MSGAGVLVYIHPLARRLPVASNGGQCNGLDTKQTEIFRKSNKVFFTIVYVGMGLVEGANGEEG